MDASIRSARDVSFGDALRFWWKLGWISFGGPTGQIAIMHAEVVERRKWVDEATFLRALSFCMMLPGPEAQQLATYLGWLLHGTRGALAAGILFVLPAAVLLWALSWIYAAHGSVPWIAAILAGLKPAVVGIVAYALVRLGKKALKGKAAWTVAALAFVALALARVPFPAVIAGAACIGALAERFAPGTFVARDGAPKSGNTPQAASTPRPESRAGFARAARVLVVCLLLWWLPVAGLAIAFGPSSTFVDQGLFFSQAALVTFGGAYAVLPYVAAAAVEQHGWLSAGAMIDGFGLAETTPGPLIIVLQFVGFLGGWNHPEGLEPWLGGLIGACITTWVTFVPCFLCILLGAPYVEGLRRRPGLSSALAAITAAVVGVVLHLAVWFARQALFPGGELSWRALDVPGLVLSLAGAAALLAGKVGVPWVVLAGMLLGLGRFLLT